MDHAVVTETDPVCQMTVQPDKAAGAFEFEGRRYLFCGKGCLAKFQAAPHAYLAKQPAPMEAPAAGAEYTCPMHPEVIRNRPGACPICGMALEPREISADTANPELIDMTRRFWTAVALGAPILLIMIAGIVPALSVYLRSGNRTVQWIEFALATPVVFWAGYPLLARGWESLRNRSLNMFTLIAMGVGAAYVYSAVATLTPWVFPPSFRERGGGIAVYFEPAAVIVALVLLGQVLELRARSLTTTAIRSLLNLAPKTARVIEANGEEHDLPLDRVAAGFVLRVRPGESVPVDGIVTQGASAVDESMITGESIPIEKMAGASLTGGTLNGSGTLVMRAERVGRDTVLANIVRLVGEAQRTRAPIQRLADIVAGYFVPAVIAVAALTFVLWAVYGPEPRMAHALVNAVAVLIIACPCALGLATPMSIMVGTGRGATAGILIRNAEALETFQKIDTLVIDKTGTLTEGKPQLASMETVEGGSEAELLRLTASLEQASEHPLAAAIVRGAKERKIALSAPEEFESITGSGAFGKVDGQQVAVGNQRLFEQRSMDLGALAVQAEKLRSLGQTVMYVAIDGRAAGLIGVADPVKSSAREAIQMLHREKLRVVMLTGDHHRTANAVAQSLGIDEVHAETLPAQKGAEIQRLQTEGRTVAMAGDGVNDAPALAQANVGIAMGTGADIAMQSAGITLVKGDLRGIVRALRLSRATMRNIRQNLLFAFLYNLLGVPIAAGLLYPFFGILLSPMLASAAMTFSSVSVIGNALRLKNVKL